MNFFFFWLLEIWTIFSSMWAQETVQPDPSWRFRCFFHIWVPVSTQLKTQGNPWPVTPSLSFSRSLSLTLSFYLQFALCTTLSYLVFGSANSTHLCLLEFLSLSQLRQVFRLTAQWPGNTASQGTPRAHSVSRLSEISFSCCLLFSV